MGLRGQTWPWLDRGSAPGQKPTLRPETPLSFLERAAVINVISCSGVVPLSAASTPPLVTLFDCGSIFSSLCCGSILCLRHQLSVERQSKHYKNNNHDVRLL
jgi:hypothetical protein